MRKHRRIGIALIIIASVALILTSFLPYFTLFQ